MEDLEDDTDLYQQEDDTDLQQDCCPSCSGGGCNYCLMTEW